MIETEKATDWKDLPHRFQKGDTGAACMCGRDRSDELHSTGIVEKAALTPNVVTEKGS